MSAIRPVIACIIGPTACGKTSLSIAAANLLNAEIVSADSVQVYRTLDIGSAKPTLAERCDIPHHMIDCVDVKDRSFSVSAYRDMAMDSILEIESRGKLPLLVGGSGLYVNALTYPLNFAIPADDAIRQSLSLEYDESPKKVQKRLAEVDPVTAGRLHPNDKKRIVRALEVFLAGGKPLSDYGNDFVNEQAQNAPCNPVIIGLTMEREKLYARIDRRVDEMMQKGLLDEVRILAEKGLDRNLPALQSIGYRQLLAHLDGNSTLTEAVESVKRETRRFAKRQMTWFRRDHRIHWLDVSDPALVQTAVDYLVEKIRECKGELK